MVWITISVGIITFIAGAIFGYYRGVLKAMINTKFYLMTTGRTERICVKMAAAIVRGEYKEGER